MTFINYGIGILMSNNAQAPQVDDQPEKSKGSKVWDATRFVWSYWKTTPWTFGFIVSGMIMAALLQTVVPFFAKALTEHILHNDIPMALWLFGGMMLMEVATMLIGHFTNRPLERNCGRLVRRVARDLFRKVMLASTDWHANAFAGSTISKLNRSNRAFLDYCDITLCSLLFTCTLFVGLLIAMWVQSPLMAGLALVTMSLYIWVAFKISSRRLTPMNRKAIEEDNRLTATVADAITCNATVKAFGAEAKEFQRLEAVLDDWTSIKTRYWIARLETFLLLGVMVTLNTAAILGTTLYLWVQGKADASDVVFALTITSMVGGYIGQIPRSVQSLIQCSNDLEDAIAFKEMPLEIEDQVTASDAVIEHGSIRFRDVSFGYAGQDGRLFDGLDLEVYAGETIGLVGRSGSGKSTFIKLLQRLYDVNSGSIEIDGVDIRAISQSSLRQHVALVPQDSVLFHRSLADNIRYGRPDASLDEVIEAAKQANAHDFIAASPEGYETLVGERGIKLSGGERQRVAIARALLSRAPVLVMDEATSSLDSVSERLIQQAVERVMQHKTTLIIAHRLSTLRAVDRILVFDQGRIVEQGSHHALMAKEGGHYRKLYETQSLGLVDRPDLVEA